MSKDQASPESTPNAPDQATQPASVDAPIETKETEKKEGIIEPAPIEQLAEQLAEATRRANENWDKFLRTQAELENLRRRSEKELQNANKYALEKFSKELLNVVDSLELGLQAAAGESTDVAKLREGMELTLKQLNTVLEKFGIRAVDPMGEKFNPDLHQAMAMQPAADSEPNTVIKVFQKGYLLHDRLLRPAMVVVAQAAVEPTRIDEQA
ncbi:nucleotide exchange factor GrpE [Methylocaldum szegediense]|uniref:Protein GrpE n=1 Tax=Methylocaldum szegediense TaxID=73780 RepID=A0ABM9I5J2_9GAMM|nr:nucleotide exchange factor GrpE [Methylocaldum szegediense]CAI8906591.1 nucleotide exchange factor GrpE [Methylocaldum szegediense]